MISIHCSLLVHQADHFITEGYQVCQAWFSLHKSTLLPPNHFQVLNIFGTCLWNYLLHHLPRYRGDADWLVVAHILILLLLMGVMTFAFF